MKIIVIGIYLTWIFIFLYLIIIMIKSNSEKSAFQTLKFENKLFLIVKYLYGVTGMKTANGAFFEEADRYVLKCEYKDGSINSFEIKKDEIDFFEVDKVLGTSIIDKTLDYNMDYSATYFSGVPQGEFVQEKGLKYQTLYETKMHLKSSKIIVFQSKKNPQEFFNNQLVKK